MIDKSSEIFTLDEVAAYLKVDKRTIYRLVAEKKLSAFKVGGAWRFLRDDIDHWIRQQSKKSIKPDHITRQKNREFLPGTN